MAIKGTLSNFSLMALNDMTVDERREIRKALNALEHPQSPRKDFLKEKLEPNFITEQELNTMNIGLETTLKFRETFNTLVNEIKQNPDRYIPMNVQRLKNTIDEVPDSLAHNLLELKKLKEEQDTNIQQIVAVIININSSSDIKALGQAGFSILCRMTNTDTLNIQPEKKINEAQKLHMQERENEFCKGYIYKWSKEEEFGNCTFAEILATLSEEQKSLYQEIADQISTINSAVKVAYDCNWKHIKLIRTVYSILQEVMARNFPQH